MTTATAAARHAARGAADYDYTSPALRSCSDCVATWHGGLAAGRFATAENESGCGTHIAGIKLINIKESNNPQIFLPIVDDCGIPVIDF